MASREGQGEIGDGWHGRAGTVLCTREVWLARREVRRVRQVVCEKNMVGAERIDGCLDEIVEGGTKR